VNTIQTIIQVGIFLPIRINKITGVKKIAAVMSAFGEPRCLLSNVQGSTGFSTRY